MDEGFSRERNRNLKEEDEFFLNKLILRCLGIIWWRDFVGSFFFRFRRGVVFFLGIEGLFV